MRLIYQWCKLTFLSGQRKEHKPPQGNKAGSASKKKMAASERGLVRSFCLDMGVYVCVCGRGVCVCVCDPSKVRGTKQSTESKNAGEENGCEEERREWKRWRGRVYIVCRHRSEAVHACTAGNIDITVTSAPLCQSTNEVNGYSGPWARLLLPFCLALWCLGQASSLRGGYRRVGRGRGGEERGGGGGGGCGWVGRVGWEKNQTRPPGVKI